MKTLDEVIKALEKCMADDAIESEGVYLAADALHYLKAFRDAKNALDAEREKTIEAYCQWKDAREKLVAQTSRMMWVDKHFQFEISDNPPLTWDELKTLEGKPIWLELLKGSWKGWDVVGGFTDDDFGDVMATVHGDDYYFADLGKTWQAYRKERE